MKRARFLLTILLLLLPALIFAGAQAEKGGTTTAMAPSDAKEAPMLAAKVAAGQLPPLEQRIPKEPYVYTMADEIGTYQKGPITVAESNPDTPFWPEARSTPCT